MPRPKGSKNKVKATKVTADFAAQIAAKQEEKAFQILLSAVEAEILKVAASIEELKTDVKSLNADLKAKKASVKKLDKEVAKLEARQAAAAQKAAEASKKAEAEDVLKKLLASGVSTDEILEKLK
jgi:predicted RNase H-like nuclease (RuvC/YqgF family)